jgi:hypothetical protein
MQVQTQMLTPIHIGWESAHTNMQAPIHTQGRSCGVDASGSGLSACRAWAARVSGAGDHIVEVADNGCHV